MVAALEQTVALTEKREEPVEPLPVPESEYFPPPFEPAAPEEKTGLRFAEDIMPGSAKPAAKAKKKKKGARGKEEAEGGVRLKKQRRVREIIDDDEEEY